MNLYSYWNVRSIWVTGSRRQRVITRRVKGHAYNVFPVSEIRGTGISVAFVTLVAEDKGSESSLVGQKDMHTRIFLYPKPEALGYP